MNPTPAANPAQPTPDLVVGRVGSGRAQIPGLTVSPALMGGRMIYTDHKGVLPPSAPPRVIATPSGIRWSLGPASKLGRVG